MNSRITARILGLLLCMGLGMAQAEVVFLDTFSFDGGGVEDDVNVNYAARQSGGALTSTYTKGQSASSFSQLSANNGLLNDALRQRVYEGTVTRSAQVKTVTDFGASLAGKTWTVSYDGRLVLPGDKDVIGWAGFSCESAASAPETPAAGDFAVILCTDGSYQVYTDGVCQTNATITGSDFLAQNYHLETVFSEVFGVARVSFSLGGTDYDLGAFRVDWDNRTSRKFEFRTQVASDATPLGYFDSYVDDLTFSAVSNAVPPEMGDVSLEVGPGGTGVVLGWMTATGQTYGVEECSDMITGEWEDVITNIAGTGNRVSVTNQPASEAGFYRAFYYLTGDEYVPTFNVAANAKIQIPRPTSAGLTSTNWCYDYAPSAMQENGTNKVWWAGPVEPGSTNWCDVILYATTTNDPYFGSWSSWQKVFGPSIGSGKFDETHTADPSVIRHTDGTYFMYYGGLKENWNTAIGVATSPDGIEWTRQNGGTHIIQWESPVSWESIYGAGQPSVTKRGDCYYMIYTSIKWADSNCVKKVTGEFVIRSTDPHFEEENSIQELQDNGNGPEWVTINRGPGGLLQVQRSYSILGLQNSWDIIYLKDDDVFMVYAGAGDNTKCYFMNENFEKVWTDDGVFFDSTWFKEQRSVLAASDGSLSELSNAPGTYRMDVMGGVYIDKDGGYSLPTNNVSNIFYYDIGGQIVELTIP